MSFKYYIIKQQSIWVQFSEVAMTHNCKYFADAVTKSAVQVRDGYEPDEVLEEVKI